MSTTNNTKKGRPLTVQQRDWMINQLCKKADEELAKKVTQFGYKHNANFRYDKNRGNVSYAAIPDSFYSAGYACGMEADQLTARDLPDDVLKAEYEKGNVYVEMVENDCVSTHGHRYGRRRVEFRVRLKNEQALLKKEVARRKKKYQKGKIAADKIRAYAKIVHEQVDGAIASIMLAGSNEAQAAFDSAMAEISI